MITEPIAVCGIDCASCPILKASFGDAEAAEQLAKILYKLNTIEDYETMQYLDRPGSDRSGENTILKI